MDEPAAELPPRRRESWSIRKIAEEIGGRPIADFQDERPRSPVSPYRPATTAALPRKAADRGAPVARSEAGPLDAGEEEPLDPVVRVYPPLTRSTGRALHGTELEHHPATLEAVRGTPEEPVPGRRPHPPGPSTRPERIYLHYLLLHLDRLSDHALSYLERAVSEEIEARKAAPPPPPS